MNRCLLTIVLSLLPLAVWADEASDENARKQHFDRQIAPLLATRCLECHAGISPKGGLDLSHSESAFAGGDSGIAIVPGKPADSLLWQRIADDEMPPKHPLGETEKSLVREWIASGATWGETVIDPLRYSSDRRAGYDWWSLQPLADVSPAQTLDSDWPRNGIDGFTLQRLAAANLQPSPPADPRTLIRRLFVDLIGLPPTPEQIEEFVADPSDQHYERLVAQLLDSPHYGERWARHWLDVARYGESDGFERNNPRKNSWPYRDWVVAALNDDMPYDQFARRQLAGDLLQPGFDGAAATGFLVAGVHNTVVGSSERMKRLARQDELEEIIGTVGQTFLGLTINCARCHDHKFDPVSSREYYQLIAAIDGVNHGEREIREADAETRLAQLDQQISELSDSLRQFDATARKAILAERKRDGNSTAISDLPQPLACWEFDDDLRDSIGKLHGEAVGGARLEDGALVVDGREAHVRTALLDRELSEKTLEAWVLLDNLDQRGGGVISVETTDGQIFDAIVFGEREPRRWMAGSNVFARTKSFEATDEIEAITKPVHVAIVYAADGTITGYRNGVPYGQSYQTGVATFAAGKSHIVFGMRHLPAGGNKMLAGRILRASLYDRALDADAIAASAGAAADYVSEQAILYWLPDEERRRREQLREELATTKSRRDELERLSKRVLYSVVPKEPGAMRVHIRGSVTDFGDEVTPGGVQAIAGIDADFQLSADATDADRRRELAAWIANPANPLFARTIVNRVWHYHFGAGIVETPNDLGFNGGRSSHPELLDWLARHLQSDGYRLKSLHRTIVLSATYRQSSRRRDEAFAVDAGNRLLWRYSPRRVEAEVIRDSILQVAGVMDATVGGPGFEDVTITVNNGTTYYEPIERDDAAFHRRTLYRLNPRGGRSAVLDTFDCPDPSTTAPRRSVTTTPLQALSLLNNAFVLQMAEHFANRVWREAGDDVNLQIDRAWRLAVGRSPNATEASLSATLVADHGLVTLCRGLFNLNEFIVVE